MWNIANILIILIYLLVELFYCKQLPSQVLLGRMKSILIRMWILQNLYPDLFFFTVWPDCRPETPSASLVKKKKTLLTQIIKCNGKHTEFGNISLSSASWIQSSVRHWSISTHSAHMDVTKLLIRAPAKLRWEKSKRSILIQENLQETDVCCFCKVWLDFLIRFVSLPVHNL